MVGWAKSLTWSLTTDKEERVSYLSIHKITELSTGHTGYGFILGAITFMVGYVKKD